MTKNRKMLVLAMALVAVAAVSSGCELSLDNVDCSGINQPDMGGLVCLGLNVLAIPVAAIAALAALVLALGAAIPV